MRRAFSLMTAIIFLVIIATFGALSLSLSNQGAKQVGDIYLNAQAELLAQSATEFAVLSVTAHDINATNNCINHIDISYPDSGDKALFNIDVEIYYLGKDLPPDCNTSSPGSNYVETKDSNLSIIVDTYVTSVKGIGTEPIRFHRRTIQRP